MLQIENTQTDRETNYRPPSNRLTNRTVGGAGQSVLLVCRVKSNQVLRFCKSKQKTYILDNSRLHATGFFVSKPPFEKM